MDLGLKNKVAFIAGATRGIGLAIARSFLAEEASVAITGRTAESLAAAEAELTRAFGGSRVRAIAGDMRNADAIKSALDITEAELGPLNAVVANVGTGVGPAGYTLSPADWTTGLDNNLTPAVLLAGQALPRLVAAKNGSLTFISSIAGIEAIGAPVPYAAAKAALQASAKSYARQVGAANVRVNIIAPGNVLFAGGEWERKLTQRREFFEAMIDREVPLRRFGQPEEIAAVAVFLASERASFITGAVVVADGGQTRSI